MDTKKLIGTIIGVTMFAVLIAGATFAWLTFGTTVTDNQFIGNTIQFVVDYTQGNNVQYTPILDSTKVIPGTSNATGESNAVTSTKTKLDENEAAGLAVIMKKNTNSAEGHAAIYLTTEAVTEGDGNAALLSAGVVRWAICRDTNVEAGVYQIDNTCGADGNFNKALNTGKITSAGTIMLLSDARLADLLKAKSLTTLESAVVSGTGKYNLSCTPTISTATGCSSIVDSGNITGTTNNINMIESNGVSYFVYIWLDGASITNEMVENQYASDNNDGVLGNDGSLDYNLYKGYVHAGAVQLNN